MVPDTRRRGLLSYGARHLGAFELRLPLEWPIRPFWLFCWSARNVDAVKVHTYGDDPGEVSRLMFEISVGWEWGAGGISTGSMKPLDRGTGVFTDDSVWVVR